MAFNILLIPAMSAKYKRVFSSAKHLLSDSLNALCPETIKGVECERNWILHGYSLN
jgi:hAT family C-terminal dimerisation region